MVGNREGKEGTDVKGYEGEVRDGKGREVAEGGDRVAKGEGRARLGYLSRGRPPPSS